MNFSKTKIFFITSICVLSILLSLGNFFNLGVFSANRVHLGLDLKGGSQILLKIDYDDYVKEQLKSVLAELKSEFRKNRIRVIPKMKLNFIGEEKENYIYLATNNENENKKIRKIIKKINSDLIV